MDNAINTCKRRCKLPVLSTLKSYIEQATNRSFEVEQFQRILTIAPELYYYSWFQPQKSVRGELRIEVPQNIEEILSEISRGASEVSVLQTPISDPMANALVDQRKNLVKARLACYAENLHNKFLQMMGIQSHEYSLNSGWHPDFVKENVFDVPAKPLKNVDNFKKTETISEFLKDKNIKQNILKRTSEQGKVDSTFDCSPCTQDDSQPFTSAEKACQEQAEARMISPEFYKSIVQKERIYKEERRHFEQESQKSAMVRK